MDTIFAEIPCLGYGSENCQEKPGHPRSTKRRTDPGSAGRLGARSKLAGAVSTWRRRCGRDRLFTFARRRGVGELAGRDQEAPVTINRQDSERSFGANQGVGATGRNAW